MKRALVALALLAAALSGGVGRSQAVFVATSTNSASSFTTAADFYGPIVVLADPGSPLKGSVDLSATASDAGSGLASLTLQRKPASGSTWTDVCTGATSPRTCSLDTTALADGLWDVRAVAADAEGNTTTETVTDRRVDNTAPTVAVTNPGAMRGTVTLASATGDGAGSGVATVAYEYRSSPAGAWTPACTGSSGPFSCGFDTTGRPDGLYDLRATATDAAGNATTSAVLSSVRIDNTPPATVTMADPAGTSLSGSVTLSGTATDAGSGIASVRFQYAPAGTTTWQDACTDTGTPYSCVWDSATAADGHYEFRALATDNAGGTSASTTIASHRVDNFAPVVVLDDPGSPLRGTKVLTATATDGGGIASVVIQRKPSSGSTWTTICSDDSSPYSCSWNTAAVAGGTYDLRAVATDNAGRTASSTVTSRVVDNTGPTAQSATATNNGTSQRLSAGDRLLLTYTEAILPGSLISGWTGASRGVSLVFARSGSNTTVAVTDVASGAAVPVGALMLEESWTGASGATLDGTITLSGSLLTLTVGSNLSQGSLRSASNPFDITWTNATTITDLAGNPGVATQIVNTGSL